MSLRKLCMLVVPMRVTVSRAVTRPLGELYVAYVVRRLPASKRAGPPRGVYRFFENEPKKSFGFNKSAEKRTQNEPKIASKLEPQLF